MYDWEKHHEVEWNAFWFDAFANWKQCTVQNKNKKKEIRTHLRTPQPLVVQRSATVQQWNTSFDSNNKPCRALFNSTQNRRGKRHHAFKYGMNTFVCFFHINNFSPFQCVYVDVRVTLTINQNRSNFTVYRIFTISTKCIALCCFGFFL